VSWTWLRDFSLRFVLAHMLGSERTLSEPDRDSRGWLQALKYF